MDVAVHFRKVRGAGTPKVFKVGLIVLQPGARIDLEARFSLAVHTTRVPQPGTHPVDVLVNGRALPAGAFEVLVAPR